MLFKISKITNVVQFIWVGLCVKYNGGGGVLDPINGCMKHSTPVVR